MWFINKDGFLVNFKEEELLVLKDLVNIVKWVIDEDGFVKLNKNLNSYDIPDITKFKWYILDREPFLVNRLNSLDDLFPKYLEFYVAEINSVVKIKLNIKDDSKDVYEEPSVDIFIDNITYSVNLIKGEDFINIVIDNEIYHLNYEVS